LALMNWTGLFLGLCLISLVLFGCSNRSDSPDAPADQLGLDPRYLSQSQPFKQSDEGLPPAPNEKVMKQAFALRQKAVETGNPQYLKELAELYKAEGEKPGARPDLWFQLGLLYEQHPSLFFDPTDNPAKRKAPAAELYRKALEADFQNLEFFIHLLDGVDDLTTEELQKVRKTLEELIDNEPKNHPVRIVLGMYLYREKDLKRAEKLLSSMASLGMPKIGSADSFRLHETLGRIHLKMRESEKALLSFELAESALAEHNRVNPNQQMQAPRLSRHLRELRPEPSVSPEPLDAESN
jgi:hypothetical protein